MAALACGEYSDIGIASLPHRLAALASWRPDEADHRLLCPGISIPSGSASLFTEVSRKTHLTLTAAAALRDAASAGGLTGDLKKADDAKRAGALKRITRAVFKAAHRDLGLVLLCAAADELGGRSGTGKTAELRGKALAYAMTHVLSHTDNDLQDAETAWRAGAEARHTVLNGLQLKSWCWGCWLRR